jgi:hypothetical protein
LNYPLQIFSAQHYASHENHQGGYDMSKGLILAALTLFFPLTALADYNRPSLGGNDQAEYLAYELKDLLSLMASDASYQASHARRYGQHAEAKALSDLASSAATLENKLLNSVIVPLRRGEADHVVKAYLQRLDSDFQLLQMDGHAAARYDSQLARDVREALYLKSDLQRALSANDRGRPERPVRPIR